MKNQTSTSEELIEQDIRFIHHQLRLRRVALTEAIARESDNAEAADMVAAWKEKVQHLDDLCLKFGNYINNLDGIENKPGITDIHW